MAPAKSAANWVHPNTSDLPPLSAGTHRPVRPAGTAPNSGHLTAKSSGRISESWVGPDLRARRPCQGLRLGTFLLPCHAAPDLAVALPPATRRGTPEFPALRFRLFPALDFASNSVRTTTPQSQHPPNSTAPSPSPDGFILPLSKPFDLLEYFRPTTSPSAGDPTMPATVS
jgi:hypothetical protein